MRTALCFELRWGFGGVPRIGMLRPDWGGMRRPRISQGQKIRRLVLFTPLRGAAESLAGQRAASCASILLLALQALRASHDPTVKQSELLRLVIF